MKMKGKVTGRFALLAAGALLFVGCGGGDGEAGVVGPRAAGALTRPKRRRVREVTI